MGTPNKYTSDFCEVAAEILSRGKSLAAVCAHFDISRSTLYEWRDNHPEFGDAINKGLQKAQMVWEEIGEDGIKGNYEKFASTPWLFTMKNRFREDYGVEEKNDNTNMGAVVAKLVDKLVE